MSYTGRVLGGKLVLVFALVVFAACSGDSPENAARVSEPTAPGAAPPPQETEPPNIVFVVADDLAKRDMRAVGRYVNPYTANEGTVLSRAHITTPVCCPSQASILRGQYTHNHEVYNHNEGGTEGAYAPFESLEDSTLATWLDDEGYETSRFGKYLVSWPGYRTPPGWDHFSVFERDTENMARGEGDYVLNTNGSRQTYDPDDGVIPDALLSKRAASWVAENEGKPKFLYLGAHAPHEANVYPGRYADDFTKASYAAPCERDLSDKPSYVRRFARDACFGGGEEYRERLRSMLTLRDALERIEGAFRSIGELDETYVVFTSDNGYHLSEHRMPPGKRLPYLDDVEVPLHIRGPGIEPGSSDALVSLADLAPTAASWAGAEIPDYVDGRDLSPVLSDSDAPWRDAVLVEAYQEATGANTRHPAPTYGTLITEDRSYTEYKTGESELYDLEADPDQLQNLLYRPTPEAEAKAAELAGSLDALKDCAGDSCRAAEDGVAPPPEAPAP